MPKIKGSSSRAGIHPYLRKEFVWPIPEDDGVKKFPLSEKEQADKIDILRKNRTFYFNKTTCRKLLMNYDSRGLTVKLNKNVVYQTVISSWDNDQLKKWKNLEEEDEIILKNICYGWWLVETIWVKIKS